MEPTAAAVQSNEIWPTFTTDADGVGRASITVNHAARPDALSIVVHDPEVDNHATGRGTQETTEPVVASLTSTAHRTGERP
jgi:hypothetical protein